MTATRKLLTIPEVQQELRKGYRFVLDELKRGNLVGSYFGSQWHIDPADLETYIEAHKNVRPVAKRARKSA